MKFKRLRREENLIDKIREDIRMLEEEKEKLKNSKNDYLIGIA